VTVHQDIPLIIHSNRLHTRKTYLNLTNKHKAYLALCATSFIWGSTWVASKIAVQKVPGLQISAIRQLIAGVIFIVFFKLKGEPWPKLSQLRSLLLIAFFLLIFANGLSTWSIRYISSGLGALIGALFPLFVVIIESLFFKVRVKPLTYIGLTLGILGIAFVFYDSAFHHQTDKYIFGAVLGLIATLSWSIGTIMVSRKKLNMNPYYGMGWQMALSSPFIMAMAFTTGEYIPVTEIPAQSWLGLAWLVFAGSCIAFVCFIYSMKHLPAGIASLYAYINPIVAMLIGSVLLAEVLTIDLLIGTIITIAGVYLVNHSMKEKPTTVPVEKEM
jgi:drug/metabolite transporter (DMT)-like permease